MKRKKTFLRHEGQRHSWKWAFCHQKNQMASLVTTGNLSAKNGFLRALKECVSLSEWITDQTSRNSLPQRQLAEHQFESTCMTVPWGSPFFCMTGVRRAFAWILAFQFSPFSRWTGENEKGFCEEAVKLLLDVRH